MHTSANSPEEALGEAIVYFEAETKDSSLYAKVIFEIIQ